MQRYLLSVYQPDEGTPPKDELDRIMANVRALRDEMQAAGAWVFSAGLHPAGTATVVRSRNGEMLTTDGPYIEGKEHIGGFTILEAPDLDAALAWARKAARIITPLAIEVRPMHGEGDH
jgi:hypothetical protein